MLNTFLVACAQFCAAAAELLAAACGQAPPLPPTVNFYLGANNYLHLLKSNCKYVLAKDADSRSTEVCGQSRPMSQVTQHTYSTHSLTHSLTLAHSLTPSLPHFLYRSHSLNNLRTAYAALPLCSAARAAIFTLCTCKRNCTNGIISCFPFLFAFLTILRCATSHFVLFCLSF